MADATYNNQAVYHQQGGKTLVIASGGRLLGESGGDLLIESGFTFYCGTTAKSISSDQLDKFVYQQDKIQIHVAASASVAGGALVPSLIYNNYKYHLITTGSNAVANTLWFASAPSVGMEMYIFVDTPTASGTNLGQSTLVTVSCDAGAIVPVVTLVSNSRAALMASSNSAGRMHLICLKAGEWSVVSTSSATAVTFA